jgi:hypothetical protein
MTHFDDADLFEAYYADPHHESIVLRHAVSCNDCGPRFHRLQESLNAAADIDVNRPDTFWVRQRLAISNRIERNSNVRSFRPTRVAAAAAVLSFFIGGAVMYRTVQPTLDAHAAEATVAAQATPVTARAAAHHSTEDTKSSVAHDAWQSDELTQFHSVVEWESWVEPNAGDKSL